MADLPKSVAELRALILPHLLDLEALDALCALAAPNAKLREAARDLAYGVLSGWIKGDGRVPGCAIIPNSAHNAMLSVAETVRELSAAPEAAKADEVNKRDKMLGKIVEDGKEPPMLLRLQRDALRAKLEAADSVAIAAQKEGVRLLRDLAAARADQRAVAVEELRHLRAFSLGQDARAICTLMDKRIAALTAPAAEPINFPELRKLVAAFSTALLDKLIAAEKKYGHNDAWLAKDWELACRDRLRDHVEKGDPRDVAAYCAFMWHHGWRTAPAAEPVPAFEGDPKDCAFGLADYVRWANEARGTPQFIHRAADVAMLLAGRALEGK